MKAKPKSMVGGHQPHLDAEAAWKAYLARLKDVIEKVHRKGMPRLDGSRHAPLKFDPAEVESLLNQCHAVAEQLFDIVERINWAAKLSDHRYGPDGNLTTESAVEMTIRYLHGPDGNRTHGVSGAWELARQSLRRCREGRGLQPYASMGIDLSAYFAVEFETILHLIELDHSRLAGLKPQSGGEA